MVHVSTPGIYITYWYIYIHLKIQIFGVFCKIAQHLSQEVINLFEKGRNVRNIRLVVKICFSMNLSNIHYSKPINMDRLQNPLYVVVGLLWIVSQRHAFLISPRSPLKPHITFSESWTISSKQWPSFHEEECTMLHAWLCFHDFIEG